MAYEDFQNDYTEVDPNGRFTLATVKNTISGFQQNEAAYVYKDFTADYFNALDVDVTLYVNSSSELYGQAGVAFANAVDDRSGFGSDALWAGISDRGLDSWISLFRDYDKENDYFNSEGLYAVYYISISRSAGGDGATCYIYDDSGRTNLVDTLSVSYGTSGQDAGATRPFTGYIENMDLSPAASTSIKSINNLAKASVKAINNLPIASVKSWNNLA